MTEIIPTVKNKSDIDMINLFLKLDKIGIKKYRFNFSKVYDLKSYREFSDNLSLLRDVDCDAQIILDIPYPGEKCRLYGNFNSLEIKKGNKYVFFAMNDAAKMEKDKIYFKPYFKDIIASTNLIIYDSGEGSFSFHKQISENCFEVIANGDFILENTKSVSLGAVKKKTYYKILNELCKKFRPDEVAFSFIESPEDLVDANQLKHRFGFKIISKIETALGIINLNQICQYSDIIMLGRGDLCLNAPLTKLLSYESKIGQLCEQKGCKYYIATDFLTSLKDRYIPIRSDLIDLQYALSLNPDAIILNFDLVVSKNIENAISLINQCDSIF